MLVWQDKVIRRMFPHNDFWNLHADHDKFSTSNANILIDSQENGSNAVVDLTAFPMPASGRTVYSNMTYNTTSNCGFMELYAYQEWAAFQYSILTGSNATISQFQRRLVLMPNNNCQFYGAGSQGCLGSYCYVWIRGDRLVHLSFCMIMIQILAKHVAFLPCQG